LLASESQSLVELLRHQCSQQPEREAYVFLEEGAKKACLTYRELDRRVRAVAAELQRRLHPGDRVLLVFPPGLDFAQAFFACLFAGVVAVPAYPPDPSRLDRTLPRLRAIAADSQPSLLLTTSLLAQFGEALIPQAPELGELKWVASDRIPDDMADDWQEVALSPASRALLQYTSGSTGNPKGVEITHSNLRHNLELMQEVGRLTRPTGVGWLPMYHDMGLIGHVLVPVVFGGLSVLMSPVEFLRSPLNWLRAISSFRGDLCATPNFALDLCVRKVPDEALAGLDLSSLEVALVGAEPVRAETLERFARRFAPCGFKPQAFYPAYGLAEATVFVSGGDRERPPIIHPVDDHELQRGRVVTASRKDPKARLFVSCGRAHLDQQIVIVDPETMTPSSSERVGEVWVCSPSAPATWDSCERTASCSSRAESRT